MRVVVNLSGTSKARGSRRLPRCALLTHRVSGLVWHLGGVDLIPLVFRSPSSGPLGGDDELLALRPGYSIWAAHAALGGVIQTGHQLLDFPHATSVAQILLVPVIVLGLLLPQTRVALAGPALVLAAVFPLDNRAIMNIAPEALSFQVREEVDDLVGGLPQSWDLLLSSDEGHGELYANMLLRTGAAVIDLIVGYFRVLHGELECAMVDCCLET